MAIGSRTVRPCFETLEDRMLLSVVYTPTSITITGDPAGNNAIVITDAAGSFDVVGGGVETGTAPTLATADQVKIIVRLGNGDNNTVTYSAATLVGNPLKKLSVTGGNLADTVVIEEGFIRDVSINNKGGANEVSVSTATITNNLTITGGSGVDTVTLGETASAAITGNINLNLGAGDNVVEANAGDYGAAGRSFSIRTGAGNDAVRIGTDTITGAINVLSRFALRPGAGNNTVAINGGTAEGAVTFDDTFYLNAGNGNDTVSVATSTALVAAPVTFSGRATMYLYGGNDVLNLSAGLDGNNVAFEGGSRIDLGAADEVTGDLLNIVADGVAATVTFGNAAADTTNILVLGRGLKDTAAPGAAGALVFLADSNNRVTGGTRTVVSTDLRTTFVGADVDPDVLRHVLAFV